jgi:hypothetical protein
MFLCDIQVQVLLTIPVNMDAMEEAIEKGDSGSLASLLAAAGVRPYGCASHLRCFRNVACLARVHISQIMQCCT